MSIADAIVNAQNKVKAVYTKCEEKGATLPETQDLANLPATIDSMSSTEGNTVQAYALGEAVNAVAGDKVTLNFSADIPLGLEGFLLPAGKNQSGSYVGPVSAAYVDSEYIYYSAPGGVQTPFYAYNKKTGGRTTLKNASSLDYISQFGLAKGSYLYQFVAGKMYTVDTASYSFYANTSDGKITLVCASQGYSHATGYNILMRDVEGFYSQIVNFHPDSVGFPVCLLDSEDKVNYPLVCRKKYTNELVTYNINTVTKTLDFVGSITKSVFADTYDDYPQCVSASLGDITFRFGDDSNFRYFYVFRTVRDENGVYDVEFLNDLRQQAIDYLTLMGLSDIYNCCGFVGNVLCLQKWGTVGGNGFIKVDPDNLTITGYDFAPKAHINYTGLYGNGYSIAYYGLEGGNQKYTVGFMQPIEQPYVATLPQTDRFFANQTLTGIVKESNNGILKVSTVEDPNNPPPAIPDEAGLETTIKYGTAEGVNGKVSKGLSVSSDYSVSGFYSNAGAVVKAKNPFVDYSGTINSFEIVMPTTMTASDSNYHIFGYLGKNSSGEMGLLVYYASRWVLRLKFEGESAYTDITGSSATLNTKTLVKVTYDSSTGYTLWLSTNGGSSWTNSGASTTRTSPIKRVGDFVIGGESTSTDGWRGSIDFKGLYIKINDEEVYNGIGPVFGSVRVGYGYFRNALTKPSNKYITYDGGTVTEDNIQGSKATTMNIVLGRSTDGESWTSDTKGYLSTQDTVVTGVNKKLPTPVYLWHDLSRITPAVPETIEPDVINGYGYEVNADVVGALAGASENNPSCLVSGFSSSNYITHSYDALRKPGNYFYVYIGFSFMVGGVEQYLLGSSDGKGPVTIRVNSSNQLVVDIFTTNSTTPTYTLTGSTTLTTGPQVYKLRLTYGTGGYVLSLSTDGGSTYAQEAKNTSTTKPYEGSTAVMWFGYSSGGSAWQNEISFGEILITCGMAAYSRWEGAKMGGSIELPVCWANLKSCIQSGRHVMVPSDTVVLYEYPDGLSKMSIGELKGSNYLNGIDLNDIGAINIDTNNVATGFDGSSQLTSGGNATVVDQPQDSFDLYFSFLFTGTVAATDSTTNLCDMGYNTISVTESDGNYYLRAYARTVSAEGGYIPGNLEFGQEGTSDEYVTYIPFAYQLSPNTRYWVRLSFSKDSGYSMWASTDGVSYSKLGEIADFRLPAEMVYMSCGYNLNSEKGISVYLNDWYINVDGKEKAWSALGTTNNLYVIKSSSNEFYLALAGGRAYYYNGSYGARYSAFLGTVELYPEGGIKSFIPGE